MSLADSLARQTHLPNAKADNTSPTKPMCSYQCGTGGSYVEKPAETWTIIPLASHLAGAPNSRSRQEFDTLCELVALIKVERSLGSGLSTMYMNVKQSGITYFEKKILIFSAN
jgi:hypothetical protein